jgi:hypothetical protein
LGALEGDRCVERAEQRRAATEQDRDHVDADLVHQAERECLLHDGRAVQPDDLVTGRGLGLLDGAGHPSVTNVNTDGYDAVGLWWVTTKHGVSPTGPASPQPPSPSFFSKDVRPITTAPQPSSIACSMARSSSVAASNIQSCSIPAPSPNGFSRLSLGPVTYPSSERDMSLITRAMGVFLS